MISIAKAAATMATFALLLYGTYVGLIRWVDTLPDPTTPMPDAAAWLSEAGDPPHSVSTTSTRQQPTVSR